MTVNLPTGMDQYVIHALMTTGAHLVFRVLPVLMDNVISTAVNKISYIFNIMLYLYHNGQVM